eukprot:2823267-Rhodomonas_salina.1
MLVRWRCVLAHEASASIAGRRGIIAIWGMCTVDRVALRAERWGSFRCFEPGDVVTATVNLNDGTASFSKKRIVQRRDSTVEFETEPTTIQNVRYLYRTTHASFTQTRWLRAP